MTKSASTILFLRSTKLTPSSESDQLSSLDWHKDWHNFSHLLYNSDGNRDFPSCRKARRSRVPAWHLTGFDTAIGRRLGENQPPALTEGD